MRVQIDIEMPIYCYDCPCHNGENGRCNITGDSTFDKRPFDCPLKEVKLADLPSAQPERKKGKWIESNDTIIRGTCSCCGWLAIIAETDVVGMPYCPNCGAAMVGYEAAKKLCPRCHSLYLNASTQCPACGWKEEERT